MKIDGECSKTHLGINFDEVESVADICGSVGSSASRMQRVQLHDELRVGGR